MKAMKLWTRFKAYSADCLEGNTLLFWQPIFAAIGDRMHTVLTFSRHRCVAILHHLALFLHKYLFFYTWRGCEGERLATWGQCTSGVCIFVRVNFVIWSRNRPKSDILQGGGKQGFFSSPRRDAFTVARNNWLPLSFYSLSSAVTERWFETGSVFVKRNSYTVLLFHENNRLSFSAWKNGMNLNCT